MLLLMCDGLQQKVSYVVVQLGVVVSVPLTLRLELRWM
jgi:hypothetical protein